MHTFKDNATPQRTWEIRISVAEAFEVRESVKYEDGKPVDLSRLFEGKFKKWDELTGDINLFAEVLYLLCKQQIEKAGLTKIEFWRNLIGDALADASEALYEELVNFCQNRKARPALRKVKDKATEIAEKVLARGERMLDQIDTAQEAENLMSSLNSSTPAQAS